MKKYILISLLLSIIVACSSGNKYDLSQIKSKEDFADILSKMKKDKVKIDTSYTAEIVGQGIHFAGIPIKKINYFKDVLTIYTDSIAYTGKKMLEQLETMNGFGKYTEGYSYQFVWDNENLTTELALSFVDGKHLAAMGEKDYAEVKYSFRKHYDAPLANLHNNVKKFDKEPRYVLFVSQDDCDTSILIDGIERIEFGSFEDNENRLELNSFLLQKGKHTIEIKSTPSSSKKFSKRTKLDATIIDISTSEVLVSKSIDVSNLISKNKFSFSLNFDAKIPYTIKGWSHGKNLRNDKQLKEKVKALYIKLGNAFVKKDEKTINDMFYDMYFENAQVSYNKDYNASKLVWKAIVNCEENSYKYSVTQNFEIVIADQRNGKLIYAKPINKNTMLVTTGKKYSYTFDFFLYQPANSNELKIIRQ